MRGWELFTPAERRLAVLLFALAVVGEFANVGRRVSPEVARWLDGNDGSPAHAETTDVLPRPVERDSLVPSVTTSLEVPPDTAAGIDPNTADLSGLQELPGVGPVLARRILEDRAEHGPYKSPEDLLRVPGIGPAKLAKLRPRLLFRPAGSRK